MSESAIQLIRMIAVLSLVCVAAALATPPGRMPLALRGLMRILRKDRGLKGAGSFGTGEKVPRLRRVVAFLLVLLAVVLSLLPF